jgi:hypothetical protein
MNSSRWERIGAATGIGSVVLIVVGFFAGPESPDQDKSPQAFVNFWLDSGNRSRNYLTMGLIAGGLLLFLWFLGSLRVALRRAEGDPGRLAGVAFGGGVAFAVLMLGAGTMFAAPGAAVDFYDRITLDGNTIMLLETIGIVLFSFAGIGSAIMIAASTLLAQRVGVFPKWFMWVGVLMTFAALASFLFLTFFGVLLWVLIASIILTRRAGAPSMAAP